MESHGVACHPTQVNTSHLNTSQTGLWYSIYLPRRYSVTVWFLLIGDDDRSSRHPGAAADWHGAVDHHHHHHCRHHHRHLSTLPHHASPLEGQIIPSLVTGYMWHLLKCNLYFSIFLSTFRQSLLPSVYNLYTVLTYESVQRHPH